MMKYDVQMNGRNFLMVMLGTMPRGAFGVVKLSPLTGKERASPRKFGFYTNVYIEAASPQEAEEKAVALLRKYRKLKQAVHNQPDD